MPEKKQRDDLYINFAQLNLVTKDEDSGQLYRLRVSMRDGYPRIQVFLKEHDAEGKVHWDDTILATFTVITMKTFIHLGRKIVAGKPNQKAQCICKNNVFENGTRTDKIEVQGIATVGKDENGVIYLEITHEKKKKVRFNILPNEYSAFIFDDDSLKDGELSKYTAASYFGYLDTITSTMSALYIKDSIGLYKNKRAV